MKTISSSRRSSLTRRILGAFLTCILAACSGESDSADAKVFLEIKTGSELGRISRTITYRDERRDVSSMVWENTLNTGRTDTPARIGDFSEIYLALTGKSPANAAGLQTVDSIFAAAKKAGWSWEKDNTIVQDGEIGERKLYRLWR